MASMRWLLWIEWQSHMTVPYVGYVVEEVAGSMYGQTNRHGAMAEGGLKTRESLRAEKSVVQDCVKFVVPERFDMLREECSVCHTDN